MKRIQLFEFEDYAWLPDGIRSSMTRLIVLVHRLLGSKAVLVNLLQNIQQQYPFERIVDMGSGSGGIMPDVLKAYNAHQKTPLSLVLTDLYPSATYRALVERQNDAQIRYQAEPLDATQLQDAPKGLKTMICSFHHLPPEAARLVLHSAQNNRQPLLVYEMTENTIPTILWWLALPIALPILVVMCLLMTPFVRPLTFQQVLFTYLIPIIPPLYAWDGQASYVRTYATEDVHELIGPKVEGYTWTIAPAPAPNGKTVGYYILGLPT